MAFTKQYRDNAADGPVSTKEIKQVAELLGMSDEGVRIYERRGFVHPDVREGSRTRSFDIMDFTMLLYSRVYRKSDFSLKETEQIVEAGAVETIQEMYGAKICELERELAQKRIVLECLHDASEAMESIPLLSNRCEIAPFPGLYRIEFMFSPNVWCDDPEQRELISTWAGYAPCTMISTRYFIRDLLDGRQPTCMPSTPPISRFKLAARCSSFPRAIGPCTPFSPLTTSSSFQTWGVLLHIWPRTTWNLQVMRLHWAS